MKPITAFAIIFLLCVMILAGVMKPDSHKDDGITIEITPQQMPDGMIKPTYVCAWDMDKNCWYII